MNLIISGDQAIRSPSAEDIRSAACSLSLDMSESAFLILAETDMTYIQCSGDPEVGFDLEYQDGSLDTHFRATRKDFDVETIVAVLSDYLVGGNCWLDKVDWVRMDW